MVNKLFRVIFWLHPNPAVDWVCTGYYLNASFQTMVVSGFGETLEDALDGMTFQLPEGWDD